MSKDYFVHACDIWRAKDFTMVQFTVKMPRGESKYATAQVTVKTECSERTLLAAYDALIASFGGTDAMTATERNHIRFDLVVLFTNPKSRLTLKELLTIDRAKAGKQ